MRSALLTWTSRLVLSALFLDAGAVNGVGVVRALSVGIQSSPEAITRPAISENVAPLESIAPRARDGYAGNGFLRRPPGAGPFPAVVIIHPGLATIPTEFLKSLALDAAQPLRFLEAGYVVAVITYRSRDVDPQTTVSLADSLAAVDYVRNLPYVDSQSVVTYGCSGGGDLALEIAAATDVAAIAAEEPASVLFTGTLNKASAKRGERYTPRDAQVILEDPQRYYTPTHQQMTREKVRRIRAPILVLQGDESAPLNMFNRQVLIPELRVAGKQVELKTYPGQSHCFAFNGTGAGASVALRAFQDVDTFFRQHLTTAPKAIDPSQVRHVPVPVQ